MKKEQKHKIPNFLLAAQASVDLFIGIQTVMDELAFHGEGMIIDKTLEVCMNIFAGYSIFLAVFTLFVSSMERYMATKVPLFHRTRVTRRRMIYATITIWFVALIPASLPIVYYHDFNENKHSRKQLILIDTSIIFTTMFFLYVVLLLTFRGIKVSMRKREFELQASTYDEIRCTKLHHIEHQRMIHIFKIFLSMVCVYAVTFLPLAITDLLNIFVYEKEKDYNPTNAVSIAHIVSYMIYISGSIYNPLITLMMKDNFKEAITKHIKHVKDRILKKTEVQLTLKNTTHVSDLFEM